MATSTVPNTNPNADPTSLNPGKNVVYNPANPFNIGVPGTGNYTGPTLPGQVPQDMNIGSPTPYAPVAPAPGSVPMPAPVKSALESVANANPPSSTPTRTSATPIDYTLHSDETIDEYNARIAAARTAASGGTATAPASTTQPSITDLLAKIGPAPTPPDQNALEAQGETTYGVQGLQTNLNNLNDQLTQLQNNLQTQQAGEASKPGVIATIINGRMQMLSAQDSAALKELQLQIKDATTQLNQANTAVKTFMANSNKNYTDASAAYDKAYSQTITQYNDEQSQADKVATAAKANAQVIINSYKGSSVGFNSITDDQKAQWQQLELQAGLPTGTIEAAVKAELNVTKFVKGSDGNTYVTGTDDNGVPFTAQVQGSQGSGSGGGAASGTWTKTQLQANINKMSSALQSAAGTDGMVSNSTWQQALSDWVSAGGTTAQFNTQFKSYKSTNASAGNS